MPPSFAYALDAAGRLRVGSLELHVAEHCNLRCRDCDVASPLWPERLLSPGEVAETLARLRPLLRAEVLKIVGGEPLLHPELEAVLRAARDSGVGERLRVTSNGRLPRRLTDDCLRLIDELTISHYSSAPPPAAELARALERAARLGVRVNLKRVDRFSATIAEAPHEDLGVVQRTYDGCWLRHCSLLVRDGVFFKCTRPAYEDERLARTGQARRPADPPSYRDEDGVPIDAADFPARALAYLLRREPLRACERCLGSSGPSRPHAQLPRPGARRLPVLSAADRDDQKSM